MGERRADDPATARPAARRRATVLGVVVGLVLVVATVGVAGGVRGDRWDSADDTAVASPQPAPSAELDVVRDDAASRAERAAETAEPAAAPTVATSPTSTPVPSPTPTAEPGSGLLGTEVVEDLGGTLDVVPGTVKAPGKGEVRTVRVEVERGLPVDPTVFADAVLTTLNDPRGWGSSDGVRFARTDGDADYRVVLASPGTVDDLCAPLATGGELSCGTSAGAMLNFTRWVHGAEDFDGDLVTYRHYLVNHEVGHLLGHGHVHCEGKGKLADVMVQQSITTEGCRPNGWPNP